MLNQQQFKKISGQVAIDIIINPAFNSFRLMSKQRAKMALKQLIKNGYNAIFIEPYFIKINN